MLTVKLQHDLDSSNPVHTDVAAFGNYQHGSHFVKSRSSLVSVDYTAGICTQSNITRIREITKTNVHILLDTFYVHILMNRCSTAHV